MTITRNRYLLVSLTLLLFSLAFYALCLRLVSQVHYLRAVNLLREKNYETAVRSFEKAVTRQPNDFMTWKGLGEAYQSWGRTKSIREAFLLGKKSEQAYQSAVRLNPLDAETFFGLAEATAKLEQLNDFLNPAADATPYNALPFFEEAVRLKPNGISYRYALAAYLHRQNKKKALKQVARDLTRIYPSTYLYLKNQMFWSPEVREGAEEGLRQAIEAGIAPRSANMMLSSLLEDKSDWNNAVFHYKEALAFQPSDNTSADYTNQGRLCLENRQIKEAENSFITALSLSTLRENDLENIYRLYGGKSYFGELHQFYIRAQKEFNLSARIYIFLARSLIDQKEYHQARQTLVDLNEKEPSAEAYYWLYRIAEIENDPDAMELAIQKATVLDPQNSGYHVMFSQVLLRMKKLDGAEKAAGLAIEHSLKPDPGLFNHRAWIRWKRNDFSGAAADWEEAVRLNPAAADYHIQAAEALAKSGNRARAKDLCEKALNLAPQNTQIQQRCDELMATISEK